MVIRKCSLKSLHLVPDPGSSAITLCKRQFVHTRDAEFSDVANPCIIGNTISISCQDPRILRSLVTVPGRGKTMKNNL